MGKLIKSQLARLVTLTAASCTQRATLLNFLLTSSFRSDRRGHSRIFLAQDILGLCYEGSRWHHHTVSLLANPQPFMCCPRHNTRVAASRFYKTLHSPAHRSSTGRIASSSFTRYTTLSSDQRCPVLYDWNRDIHMGVPLWGGTFSPPQSLT